MAHRLRRVEKASSDSLQTDEDLNIDINSVVSEEKSSEDSLEERKANVEAELSGGHAF